MALFSVGIRTKREYPNAFSVVRRNADKYYVVEAETERKAENVVKRHLKELGVVADITDVIPADILQ